jgi:hypothetical protein
LAVLGCVAWWNQTGCISYRNFERINKGMELERVEELLGSPREEIPLHEVPGVPPYAKFPEAPDGWLGVVWGERCYRWEEHGRWIGGDRTIYVGVTGGRVVSKFLDEDSL